ncbi:hypothetical protein PDESU_03325 [Pontiella desulfatans]|uniref:Uncharacterized protein n=1 Tax=Pontiella desulfatans TaxID=2750659 RepID=A0A6C2U5S5_PONDE|nr:hypothetical protein [Pontiella desulfatans]VGO14756.1 hypothetical protein PDESU_03325 [Pontiella desulfatans]
MGVKRGNYQTKKQLLQRQCEERGIKYATRWGSKELQAALDGKRPSPRSGGQRKALRDECRKQGIAFSDSWNVAQLKQALAGNLKPYRNTGAKVCLPMACTCGKAIDPAKALEGETRRDPRMHQATPDHNFDGVIFCRYCCACGQHLVVKVPIKARAVKCGCGRLASMWDADGVGTCCHCATKK